VDAVKAQIEATTAQVNAAEIALNARRRNKQDVEENADLSCLSAP